MPQMMKCPQKYLVCRPSPSEVKYEYPRKERITRPLAPDDVIRDFEETADKLSLRGKVSGGMHNSSGQEAVAVGVLSLLILTMSLRQLTDRITTLLQRALALARLWLNFSLVLLNFRWTWSIDALR